MLFRYSDGFMSVFSSVAPPTLGNLGGTKGKTGVAPSGILFCSDTFFSFLFLTRSEGLTIISSSSSSLEILCPNNCSRLVKEVGAEGGVGGAGGGATGADKLCLRSPEI